MISDWVVSLKYKTTHKVDWYFENYRNLNQPYSWSWLKYSCDDNWTIFTYGWLLVPSFNWDGWILNCFHVIIPHNLHPLLGSRGSFSRQSSLVCFWTVSLQFSENNVQFQKFLCGVGQPRLSHAWTSQVWNHGLPVRNAPYLFNNPLYVK